MIKVIKDSNIPDWDLFDNASNDKAVCYIVGKHNGVERKFSSTKLPEVKGEAFHFQKSHFLFEGDIAPLELSQGQSVFIVSEIHLREKTSFVARIGGVDKAKEALEVQRMGFYCKSVRVRGVLIGEMFLDKIESAGSIPEKELIDLQQLQCELFLLSLIGD